MLIEGYPHVRLAYVFFYNFQTTIQGQNHNQFQKYMGHLHIFTINTDMFHVYSYISHFTPAPLINVDLECELHIPHLKQPNIDTQHWLGGEGEEEL